MGEISQWVEEHDRWRLEQVLNLQPSENVTSLQVRRILASDLGHRYTLPWGAEFQGSLVENAYRGTRFLDRIEKRGETLAQEVFGLPFATLKPLSGHLAGMLALLSGLQKKDLLMTVWPKWGGYDGYSAGYLPDILGFRVNDLPFQEDRWTLDTEASAAAIRKKKPKMVLLGSSFFLFPYELAPLAEACSTTGSLLAYDASHVLGLIAGKTFQDPAEEGVDLLFGSTHKSFFGPQGGILLSRREDLFEKVRKNLTWRLLDNAHWNRIAGLAQALEEAKSFGKGYARQVQKNAQVLGKVLDEEGLAVRYGAWGYTQSHQIHLDPVPLRDRFDLSFHRLSDRLESQGLIVDAVGRLGTAEITRMGAKEDTMEEVARLVVRAAKGEEILSEVQSVRQNLKLSYCFET